MGAELEGVIKKAWPPVEPQARPRQSETPHPSPIYGMYNWLTVFLVGVIIEDTALRKQCVIETIWTVYVPNPVKASI